ncbi:MAG: hypothetical protein U0326_23365 [Polyangiales bacterium]
MFRQRWRLALAATAFTASASAQTAPEVEATWRAMVADAESAQAAGDHARALDVAMGALRIHESPSLHEFIAREQSSLGRVVAALASAHRCIDLATAAGPSRAADLGRCTQLVATLERGVGRVVLSIASPAPTDLRVTVNGAVVASELLGAPYVVPIGEAVVEGSARDRSPARVAVTVTAGATVPVSLTLPERAADRTPRAVAPPSPLRTAAVATAIGGGALLAGGVVALLIRNATGDTFNSAGCQIDVETRVPFPAGRCTDLNDTVKTAEGVEVAAFVAGGVAVAAASVLWLLAPSRREESPARTALSCGPTAGRFGLSCSVSF